VFIFEGTPSKIGRICYGLAIIIYGADNVMDSLFYKFWSVVEILKMK
jgi:hypothetical protein